MSSLGQNGVKIIEVSILSNTFYLLHLTIILGFQHWLPFIPKSLNFYLIRLTDSNICTTSSIDLAIKITDINDLSKLFNIY